MAPRLTPFFMSIHRTEAAWRRFLKRWKLCATISSGLSCGCSKAGPDKCALGESGVISVGVVDCLRAASLALRLFGIQHA
jgi:hypothetical protein